MNVNKLFSSKRFIIWIILLIIISTSSAHALGPAESPVPVFGYDTKHTNNSPYNLGSKPKKVLWTYKTGSGIENSPVIGPDGTIYTGSHDGYFYAFEKDGTLKWKVELTKPNYDPRWNASKAMMATPAVASDGTIYTYGASNFLQALNPSDGSEKWRYPIQWDNDFWSSPTIGPDGTIYIGSARDENTGDKSGLYAINPDGTKKWFVKELSGITVVPTIADDGTIYYGAANPEDNKGKIIALTPDGNKKWEFVLKEWIEGSAAIGPDGTIYTGSKEGDFYAINPDGTEKWRFHTNGGISATPTIDGNESVYIGSWDGNFYAFDQKTGKEKWRFDAKAGRDPKLFEGYPGKETLSTNAPLTKDRYLIFGDVFDTIYVLNTEGKEIWRWKYTYSSGYAGTVAIDKDGTVYIGNEGGTLFALSENAKDQKSTKDENKNNLTNSKDTPDYKNSHQPKSPSIQIIISIALILTLVGLAYDIYHKKRFSTSTILIIAIIAIEIISLFLLQKNYKSDIAIKNNPIKSDPVYVVDSVGGKDSKSQNKDLDFINNSIKLEGSLDVRVRDFGEVGRSCTGRGCGSEKETCIRWNKNKDQCYETTKTKPASSDKYKIYCNMAIVNQDKKRANINVNLNYTTKDGVINLVRKEVLKLNGQSGESLGWSFDVDANNLGICGYSDIIASENN